MVLKVFIKNPKKPNSANRKVAKVRLRAHKWRRRIIVMIPGIGHKVVPFMEFLIRGGRVRDLPGVRYKAIRCQTSRKYGLRPVINRRSARSKYGNNFDSATFPRWPFRCVW